jgi:inorganic phosphate transporter, PiT family
MELALVLLVVFVAIAFTYTNGFHDTANAIATSIATKVMTPNQAIIISTFFNLVGALMGVAVAKTIGTGLVDMGFINLTTVLCCLLSAIAWNVLTWWVGLPSSSSHALVGGLIGAALASAGGNWDAIIWYRHTGIDPVTHAAVELPFFKSEGLWPKVLAPMIIAPAAGLVIGFGVMGLLYLLFRAMRPRSVNYVSARLQWGTAMWMSLEHGRNDAQKNMGIIALALVIATKAGYLNGIPSWLEWLRTPEFTVTMWMKLVCAVTIGLGTAAGGWKIIKTMGSGMVRLQPVNGLVAQGAAAGIIGAATGMGIPLSTTQVISSSIMGVGASKRFGAVKWLVAERMLWAWIFTIPATAVVAFGFVWLLQKAGMAGH